MTPSEQIAAFLTGYERSRAVFPLLPQGPHVEVRPEPQQDCSTDPALATDGKPTFGIAEGYDVAANELLHYEEEHESLHAYALVLAKALGTTVPELTERFRVRFGYPTDYAVPGYNPGTPSLMEAWAEVGANAVFGKVVTTKSALDEQVDPLVARAWFLSLFAPSAATAPVVDYYSPHGAEFMSCLVANGVAGIARYLTIDSEADPRAVTPQEIADAHSAGLSVHFFFEMSPTYFQYFTFENGQRDARAARWHLSRLMAPHGTVVYFTVDAPASRIPVNSLDPYIAGIRDVLRNEDDGMIVPGLYGYEEHIEYIRATFPDFAQHLAQTYGTPRGPLDLWQHEQTTLCGVAVDINDCTVTGWQGEDMTPDEVVALIEQKYDLVNTLRAIKDRLAADAHHTHNTGEPAST